MPHSHTPCQRFGCRWETPLCDHRRSAGEHIPWLCEPYKRLGHHGIAIWLLIIQFWWWIRHYTQFDAHLTAQDVLPAGRSWAVPDSTQDQSEADGQCLVINNCWPFLYSILSLTDCFHTDSGAHPTRLGHSWSASWELDLTHCWITTLCNFSACSVFSRWEAGLSQPLVTSKIKINTTFDHLDCNRNLKKALALLCFSKPA